MAGTYYSIEDNSTGDVLWSLTDHLGSVRDLVDSNGAVENHIVYDSYGNVVSEADAAVEFLYGFTGRERDEESGLNYHRARYYDSETGGWISNDPIGFAGGDTNVSRYVGNDPVNFIDPSGLTEIGRGDEPSDAENVRVWGATIHYAPGGNPWYLGTAGDWLDVNASGGDYGEIDASGQAMSYGRDIASIAPIAGEINDAALVLTGVGNNGEELTWGERGLAAIGLAIPLVPAGLLIRASRGALRGADEAVGAVDDVIDNVDDIIDGGGVEPGDLPPFTFRGDSRSQDEIFEDGFTAIGDSQDIALHVNDNMNPPSAFISTSKALDVAQDMGDHVYTVNPVNGIDVNDVLGPHPLDWEQEVVIPWYLSPENVRAVTPNGGDLTILNPNWVLGG